MIKKLLFYLCTFLTAFCLQADDSINHEIIKATHNDSQIVLIRIRQFIDKELLIKIKEMVAVVNGDPAPAGLIVLLESPGGDGMAAMDIGEIFRKANAHIFVTGKCSSACVYILASGVVRGAAPLSLGIHYGNVTMTEIHTKVTKEADRINNPVARNVFAEYEKRLPLYLSEMGISPDFIEALKAHPESSVYRLNEKENLQYKLVGIDEAYLEKRIQYYSQKTGIFHMNKDDFLNRTASVVPNCAKSEQDQLPFIRCYQKTMSGK